MTEVEKKTDVLAAAQERCVTKGDLEVAVTRIMSTITAVRTDLSEKIGNFRTELKEEIGNVRTELKEEIGNVRIELKEEIGNVRADILELKGKQDGLSKSLSILAIFTIGLVGIGASALYFLFGATYDQNAAISALDSRITRLESTLDARLSAQDAKIELILEKLQALPAAPAADPEPSAPAPPATGSR
ncbi:MAG: hypothetical protein LBG06_11005 [Deltaproteobacteria bacterium]|nr:hypothetical protein [Deltaproteobacteria bacterium]